jgi:hypothetical protein
VQYESTIEVPVFGIIDLLELQERWDMVHIDVQGAEAELCQHAIGALTRRAAWVIIGTHSRLIEGELLRLFHGPDWMLENEKPARFSYSPHAPSLEAMTTVDGIQVWKNLRLQ